MTKLTKHSGKMVEFMLRDRYSRKNQIIISQDKAFLCSDIKCIFAFDYKIGVKTRSYDLGHSSVDIELSFDKKPDCKKEFNRIVKQWREYLA